MSLIHLGERANAGNPGNPGSLGWLVLLVSAIIYAGYRAYQQIHEPPSKRDFATPEEVKKCTGSKPTMSLGGPYIFPEDWPCYQRLGFKRLPKGVEWQVTGSKIF